MTTQQNSDATRRWLSWEQLTKDELYQILCLRQEVFIVEQSCPYLDADGLDQLSHHLMVQDNASGQLLAYMRLITPGAKYPEPALGRLLTCKQVRGSGIARTMMISAIHRVTHLWPGQPLRISAQHYLLRFYESLGFSAVSAPYDEDGIEHIEMLFTPPACAA